MVNLRKSDPYGDRSFTSCAPAAFIMFIMVIALVFVLVSHCSAPPGGGSECQGRSGTTSVRHTLTHVGWMRSTGDRPGPRPAPRPAIRIPRVKATSGSTPRSRTVTPTSKSERMPHGSSGGSGGIYVDYDCD